MCKLTNKNKARTKEAAQNQREGASPSPSEGGDVRGYGGIWWLTKPRVTASPSPSRGRGCAWRDMKCWLLGEIEELRFKA